MKEIEIIREDGSVIKCTQSESDPNAFSLTLNGQPFDIMEEFEEIMNVRREE